MNMKYYHEYKVGDSAWIFIGDHKGEASKGTVVAVLDVEGYGRQYLIAIPTGIEDLLEVRDGHILGMRPKDPKIGVIADLINRGNEDGLSAEMIARSILIEIGE